MGEDDPHPNHINVQWMDVPRDKVFSRIVFAMNTLYEFRAAQFKELVESKTPELDETANQAEFVLKRYPSEGVLYLTIVGSAFNAYLILD